MNKFHQNKANASTKTDADIELKIQQGMLKQLDDEFSVAVQNLSDVFDKADDYYDMIHCVRDEIQFDDEPNIYLPEYVSRLLTQLGNFNSQYFGSRDYVDVYQESEDPKDVAEAKASKKLLNAILNMKESYYYAKLQRLLMTVNPKGYAIIKGGYEQKIDKTLIGYEEKRVYRHDEEGNPLDENGELFSDPYSQKPGMDTVFDEVYDEKVITDRPTFDVYPNNSVFFSPEYTYSLQDKEYVIFECEKTLDGLEADKERMGYFNLDILKDEADLIRVKQTEEGKQAPEPTSPRFRIRERWGKYPLINRSGSYDIGIDESGKVMDKAENIECIITTAVSVENPESSSHLIGFRVSPHSKRPMVRFLCYVDEVRDTGIGDGETNIELQTAVNDNFNLSFYRTQLATKPWFKGRRFAGIPDKVRVHSEEVTLLENMDDLQEIIIKDDISGALATDQRLMTGMDRSTATYPTTMGDAPDRRETATVGAIMDKRASIRQGLKNLNLEFIGFSEFYDMLLTLCNDFMLPETLESLIGEYAFAYNPNRDDKFKPVTQALETEHSKQFKINMWQQLFGMASAVPNPKTPQVLNYILGQILEITGGEFKAFKEFMFEEDVNSNVLYQLATGGKAPQPQQQQGGMMPPMQNQRGLPQPQQEQQVRQQR